MGGGARGGAVGAALTRRGGPEHAGNMGDLAKPRVDGRGLAPLRIDYPKNESVFPPEIVAPTFLWHESAPQADTWFIDVVLPRSSYIRVLSSGRPPPRGAIDPLCLDENQGPYEPTPYQASARTWTPDATLWTAIKRQSVQAPVTVSIYGFRSDEPHGVLSRGSVSFATSRDPVGAPIFYRDVPLLPTEGDEGVIRPLSLDALPLIKWRLLDISRPESRVVLHDMPTCANCHSFSADGKTLGMDVDGPPGDKGSYAIVPVDEQMQIGREDVITWNSFPDKPPGHNTIGFLSQVSPDGQYVVTTVNESVFVANFINRTFLQVFYPTRGILAYYSRAEDEMRALPGADDPQYVHCAATWSPDGRYLVFCRARARDPYPPGRPEPTCANDPAELPIQYDLCRIPFNDGQGGVCKPIRGASKNAMSNTFPKISPDGKWIVFVKCRNGQLMRPDGKLWIVPTQGGKARPMRCNTWRMNSWHSFSPNGRWLVFSSKANTPFTQMFLTHVDDDGNDSPAVLIPNATAANRAVNIPEFVNTSYDQLAQITVPAVQYFRHFRRAEKLSRAGLDAEAVAEYEIALAEEPDDWRTHGKLAESLRRLGRLDVAKTHFHKALASKPEQPVLHNQLALLLARTEDADKAMAHFDAAVALAPTVVLFRLNRAVHRRKNKDWAGAMRDYTAAIRLDETSPAGWYGRGGLRKLQKDWSGAAEDFKKCLQLAPEDWPRRAQAHSDMAMVLIRTRNFRAAIAQLDAAIQVDPELVDARCNRGSLRRQMGDIAGAREDFDVAIRLDPGNPVLWYNRGIVRKQQEDWSGAAHDLGKFLELAPRDLPDRAKLEEQLRQIKERAASEPVGMERHHATALPASSRVVAACFSARFVFSPGSTERSYSSGRLPS